MSGFSVRRLRPASLFDARVYASNRRGRSEAVAVRVSTVRRKTPATAAAAAAAAAAASEDMDGEFWSQVTSFDNREIDVAEY